MPSSYNLKSFRVYSTDASDSMKRQAGLYPVYRRLSVCSALFLVQVKFLVILSVDVSCHSACNFDHLPSPHPLCGVFLVQIICPSKTRSALVDQFVLVLISHQTTLKWDLLQGLGLKNLSGIQKVKFCTSISQLWPLSRLGERGSYLRHHIPGNYSKVCM